MKKRFFATIFMVFVLLLTTSSGENVHAYRASKTVSSVTSKADLPYFSDFSGCGKYKAYSSTSRSGFKNLEHHVSFYTVGGSVSFKGAGLSGSSSSPGYSKSTSSKSYYSSGNVCGSFLSVYLGMYTTTHVNYSSRTYTATAKI